MQHTEGMVKLTYSHDVHPSVGAEMRLIEDPGSNLIKKAADTIFGCDYEALRPDKNHVGIHTIALGDSERYPMNRNGDLFPKLACERYHHTFVKNGHVFRNHDNRDPEKAIGTIVKSAYNEPMGRIELFLHVNKEKAQPELHKLATEGGHAFSMACLRAGTPITTEHGLVPVEDVQPGTRVLTHTGRWCESGNRSVRQVESYLRLGFVSWGRRILEITGNHEMYVARFEDIGGRAKPELATDAQYRRAHKHELHKFARWVPAADVTDSHYALMPIDREESSDLTEDFARVLGYYVAEGSLSDGTTSFTCNVNDAAVTELPHLADWTSVTVRARSNSKQAVSVDCFGTDLRNQIESLCGRRGENKRIPLCVRHASRTAKLHFLAGWFNGDGWQDAYGLHWSTHYEELAIGLQQLLASLNIPAGCMRIDHPEDRGIVKSSGAVEYVVSISNQFSSDFVGISKAQLVTIYGTTKRRVFISGDYLCIPVASKEVVNEPCDVYNFSVDEDESYVAYGLAVHNCKVSYDRCTICGTLRKSAADPRQCEHIRDHLGDTWADGRAVGTYNDTPAWFDESFVGRPADRIAWDLKVACAGHISSIKQAEAAGIWVPDNLEMDTPRYAEKLALVQKLAEMEARYVKMAADHPKTNSERYFWELRKAAATRLPDSVVSELRKYNPDVVLAKLAASHIVLDPETFFKYAMDLDYGGLKDEMPRIMRDIRGGLFTRLYKTAGYQRACKNNYFDVDAEGLSAYSDLQPSGLSRLVLDQVALGAFTKTSADARIVEITICGGQPKVSMLEWNKCAEENLSVHRGAELYAAYKLSALDAMGGCHMQDSRDTMLALAAAQNLVV